MKKLLGTLTALSTVIFVHAQFSVRGKVTDTQHQALKGVSAVFNDVKGKTRSTISQEDGSFIISGLPNHSSGSLNLEFVGKKKVSKNISVDNSDVVLDIVMEDNNFFLEPLEVKALRATDKSPFTKTNLAKAEIEKNNIGQDLPFILNQTPSVVVNSDAGTGIGYTGIRIRGTDATRINVTLNGIPYNDAESQGSFFVDMPDVISSVNSIQIQRGVGTSTNGSGTFGATINLSTNEFNEKAYAESNNSYGSFNSWKNTIKVGSGLINDHFTVDARLSRISSDGYIDRASSNLQSFYFSTAYVNKKTSVRFNIISGKEKTYQAWNGVPESMLSTDRTYNSLGTDKPGTPYDNQTDNYQQDHYQLFVNQAINNNLSFNIATFLVRGKGYYEEYKGKRNYADYGLNNVVFNGDSITQTDLIQRQWLDNYFYGQVFSLHYKKQNNELTFGGGWNKYDGGHYGKVLWAEFGGVPSDYQWYDNNAYKTDINVYAKWLHSFNSEWSIFADAQYRYVLYKMDGFKDNPSLYIRRPFNFFNPKAGITYTNNGWTAYASYAVAGKEPNRDDFEANPIDQPKAEQLQDFELAVDKKYSHFNFGATFYYMTYKDQLVLTGKMNDVGAYTRTNTPESYRAGVEIQAGAVITNWLNINTGAAFSRNKIKSFTEYLDDYDNGKQVGYAHNNVDISFSPSIIANGSVNFLPCTNFQLSLLSKYVGKQYLDNTQDNSRKISDYYTQDVRAIYTVKNLLFKEWNIAAQVNNVFNRMYESNGAAYPYISNNVKVNDNYYFPMAGINYMLSLNVKL